jgi:hypothetical protein
MKRLFVLRAYVRGPAITAPSGEPIGFTNKMDAKAARDLIGGSVVVSKGPDHRRYSGAYRPNKH